MYNPASDRYEVLQEIGSGQFGIVQAIRRLSDQQVMIWKKVKYGAMNSQQKNQVISQVNILKDINHPHIIKYYDRIVDKKQTTVYIVMEYCPGGDLAKKLKEMARDKEYLDEDIIWKIFFQLLTALHYCHSREKKILHRDIKPANVFIDSTGGNIKLGDFGLSKELSEFSIYADTHLGTPYYMSPEQIRVSKYNEKSDIWAAGCMIYELAALKRPFTGSNLYILYDNIIKGTVERIPSMYSQNLFEAIKWMLEVNPERRPCTADLLSLPMIKARLEDRQIKQKYEKLKEREIQLTNYEKQLDAKIAEMYTQHGNEQNKAVEKEQLERSRESKSRTAKSRGRIRSSVNRNHFDEDSLISRSITSRINGQ